MRGLGHGLVVTPAQWWTWERLYLTRSGQWRVVSLAMAQAKGVGLLMFVVCEENAAQALGLGQQNRLVLSEAQRPGRMCAAKRKTSAWQ